MNLPNPFTTSVPCPSRVGWVPLTVLMACHLAGGDRAVFAEVQSPSAAAPIGKLANADPRHQEIEAFVRTYFRTWSDRDIENYERCFLPKASIHFIDPNGAVTAYTRPQFVASQRKYHRASRQRAVEVAESMDIHVEARLVRAVVYWKLTVGSKTDHGYDHFTLVKEQGKWRIVNLVFYTTKSEG